MTIAELLDALWRDYVASTPQAQRIHHLLAERGELKSGAGFLNHFLPNGTGVGAMLQRAEKP